MLMRSKVQYKPIGRSLWNKARYSINGDIQTSRWYGDVSFRFKKGRSKVVLRRNGVLTNNKQGDYRPIL